MDTASSPYGRQLTMDTAPMTVRSLVTRFSAITSSVRGLLFDDLCRSRRTTEDTDDTLLRETVLRRELCEIRTGRRISELWRRFFCSSRRTMWSSLSPKARYVP